jgi:hypothetical protein
MPDRYALACISRPIRTRSKPFGFIQPPPADLRSSAGDGRGEPIAGHFQHRFRTLVSTRSTEVGRAYAQCELSGGWTIPAIRRRTNYEQKLPEPSCRPPQQTGSPGSYSRPEAPSGRLNLNSCFCFNYSKTNSTYAQPYAQTRLPQNGRLAA